MKGVFKCAKGDDERRFMSAKSLSLGIERIGMSTRGGGVKRRLTIFMTFLTNLGSTRKVSCLEMQLGE